MLRLRLVGSAILVSCAVAGCASTRTIAVDQSALDQFRGETIAASQRPMPVFLDQTAGKVAWGAFGLIGGAIEGAEIVKGGAALVRNNEIPDPADSIKRDLLTDLETDQGLKPAALSVSTNSSDVATLAKQYGAADLLLDVQTINWGFLYFPSNWRHYKVLYTAKMRLIDTRRGKLLATGVCSRKPESDAAQAPTYAELTADHAALLKKELAQAAQTCTDQFRARALLENAVASR